MRVSIKSASQSAKNLYKKLKERSDIHVVSFQDNNCNLWGENIGELKVDSMFKMLERYKDGEVEKVLISGEIAVKSARDMYKELIEVGVKKEDILFVAIESIKDCKEKIAFLDYANYNYIEYLEFHITNKCNLNCAGCSHFVPLIPEDDEVDFDRLCSDLSRLKQLVSHVGNIRIMGGEPLLCEKMIDFCEITRRLYPHSNIKIVSNGILVGKLSDYHLNKIRELEITFDITCYPPVYGIYDKIAEIFKQNRINYSMDIRWGLCPVLHHDEEHKFRYDCTALSCECWNLYKGKIYPCPLAAYVTYFNKYYNEKFPDDEGVDINREVHFEELYKNVIKSKKICDYCDHYGMTRNYDRRKFKQVGSKPQREDWLKN